MSNLERIQEVISTIAKDDRDYWYAAGQRARGTDEEYTGRTWVGYYAFHEGKLSCE